MNEPAMESFPTKQVFKARLMLGCLVGLLAINILSLGIVPWTSTSRVSAAVPETTEISQDSAALPTVVGTPADVKVVEKSTKADSQPSDLVESIPPADKTEVVAVPVAIVPPSSQTEPNITSPTTAPATEPTSEGLQEALRSLKPLFAQASGAFVRSPKAETPTTPSAPPRLQSTVSSADSGQATNTQLDKASPAWIRLVNPIQTGGTVHYAVDGIQFSLRPGESHEIPQGAEPEIEFHRGDDFGFTKVVLQEGDYVFTVGRTGWNLAPDKRDISE